MPRLAPGSVHRVAVIGLGTGEIACYAQPGEDWTFYEIDPLVEQIARDPRYFEFVSNCGNQPRVVLGDAPGAGQVATPMGLVRRRSISSFMIRHSSRG